MGCNYGHFTHNWSVLQSALKSLNNTRKDKSYKHVIHVSQLAGGIIISQKFKEGVGCINQRIVMDIINELEKYLLTEIQFDEDIDKQSISPEENLLSQGIIDSLAFLKLTNFIENTFRVKIGDEDMEPENFMNLNSLKNLIESKQQVGK